MLHSKEEELEEAAANIARIFLLEKLGKQFFDQHCKVYPSKNRAAIVLDIIGSEQDFSFGDFQKVSEKLEKYGYDHQESRTWGKVTTIQWWNIDKDNNGPDPDGPEGIFVGDKAA